MKEYYPVGYAPDVFVCHQNRKAFFIRSGCGLLRIGDNDIEIRQGSVVVIPPGSTYSITNTNTMPIDCIATLSGCETDEINDIFNRYIDQNYKI